MSTWQSLHDIIGSVLSTVTVTDQASQVPDHPTGNR
jgi:hypothetical protein